MDLVSLVRHANRAWLAGTPLAAFASVAEPAVGTADAIVGAIGLVMLHWLSLRVLNEPSEHRLRTGAAVVNAAFALVLGLPAAWQLVVVPGSALPPLVALVLCALSVSMLATTIAIARLPRVRPFT